MYNKFYVLIYVYDLNIIGEDNEEINKLTRSLGENFETKDMGIILQNFGNNII